MTRGPLKAIEIMWEVADQFGYSPQQLKSKSRAANLVEARWMAIYRVRTETNLSSPEIGRIFNRDHSSILWAVKKFRERLMSELQIKAIIRFHNDMVAVTDQNGEQVPELQGSWADVCHKLAKLDLDSVELLGLSQAAFAPYLEKEKDAKELRSKPEPL